MAAWCNSSDCLFLKLTFLVSKTKKEFKLWGQSLNSALNNFRYTTIHYSSFDPHSSGYRRLPLKSAWPTLPQAATGEWQKADKPPARSPGPGMIRYGFASPEKCSEYTRWCTKRCSHRKGQHSLNCSLPTGCTYSDKQSLLWEKPRSVTYRQHQQPGGWHKGTEALLIIAQFR